jgi:hypothetical protein
MDEKDMNAEQRFEYGLRNKKPIVFYDDLDSVVDTAESIKTAEKVVGSDLGTPNEFKKSYWYTDKDLSDEDKKLSKEERLEKTRGPVYKYTEERDQSEVENTLHSVRYAEDFYGVRHPNRFTGEFSGNGDHLVKDGTAGLGKY